jgi:hypothetical protein
VHLVRPPVVAGVGAGMGAGGGLLVSRFYERTTKGCASVGFSDNGHGGAPFVPHCLEPGMAMVAGLVLVIGGAVLFLWGGTAMVRSWTQRERVRGPDVLPPLERTEAAAGSQATMTATSDVASISPPPGWYAVPPSGTPMWWDGRAWATAPTLPAVGEPAAAEPAEHPG